MRAAIQVCCNPAHHWIQDSQHQRSQQPAPQQPCQSQAQELQNMVTISISPFSITFITIHSMVTIIFLTLSLKYYFMIISSVLLKKEEVQIGLKEETFLAQGYN